MFSSFLQDKFSLTSHFAKTPQIMDTIKGTMTEIYNDLSKSTSGNTIAEVNSVFEAGA